MSRTQNNVGAVAVAVLQSVYVEVYLARADLALRLPNQPNCATLVVSVAPTAFLDHDSAASPFLRWGDSLGLSSVDVDAVC